jgi:hypothetical protein
MHAALSSHVMAAAVAIEIERYDGFLPPSP